MTALERNKISSQSLVTKLGHLEIKWKQSKAPWHSFSSGTAEARVYEAVKAIPVCFGGLWDEMYPSVTL